MKSPLALRCSVSPPLAVVGNGNTVAHTLLSLDSGTFGPPIGLELKIARVGSNERSLPVLPDAFRALSDGMGARDSIIFAGRHSTGIARAGPEPVHALRSPWPDLASAFHGVHSLLGGIDEGRLVWVIFIIETAAIDATPVTVQGLQALVDAGAGVDLVCTHPAASLGMLSRLAQRAGGELIQASSAEVVERVLKRVAFLRDQRVRGVRLEIRAPQSVRIQRVFRVRPTPAFVGVPPPGSEMALALPGGAVGGARDPAWVISTTVPARRPGRYRLLDVQLRYQHGGQSIEATARARQEFATELPRMVPVEADVNAALNRVETAAWVEEIGRAHDSGEARRVAGLLDRLVRHAVTLDDRGLVSRAFEMRLGFLRSGQLSITDLNALRRQAIG